MAEPFCEVWELPKAQCAHCTGATLGDEPDTRVVRRTAEFPSRCPSCSEPIEPGDVIAKHPGDDYYIHEECLR